MESIILPLFHESVGFDFIVKVDKVSRVAPRLDCLLLANGAGEAPLQSSVGLVDLRTSGLVN